MSVTRPVISALKYVRTTSWSMARVTTIHLTSGAIGWAGRVLMDLGRGSPTTGGLGSASGLERANGWERGGIHGGGRIAGAGGPSSITSTSSSISSTFTSTGEQAPSIANTG